MQLNKMQARFKDIMLDHPDVLDAPPADLAALFDQGNIKLPDRLKIYRNNIIGSLTDAMSATFPVIEDLVGKQFFEMMARAFILKNPPAQGNLNLYGEGFDGFIASYEMTKALPYLPDIAAFEIAFNAAYYAPDDKALALSALESLNPEQPLPLRHSAAVIDSRWPLSDIRSFCLKKDRPDDATLNISKGGQKILTSRPDLDVQIVILADDEHAMLSFLSRGILLGQALEKTLAAFPDFDFPAFLQKHVSLKTFKEL